MIFLIITVIVFFIIIYNKIIEPNQFIKDTQGIFKFLIESDYEFLLKLKYGTDVDVSKMFGQRVRNGLIAMVAMFFLFLSQMQFVYVLFCVIIGFVVFKQPYSSLRSYYKRNLHHINLMLPYYLKSLEILVQHYTVPVALSRSIEQAPEIFKPGLRSLVSKIEAGDMTVDPYMDFAKEYPVRDSMRMMRLLYRLSLGRQERKQEQIIAFSRSISSLQQKARETRYKNRLEKMEGKTMQMLICTGVGMMVLLILAVVQLMGI